MKTLKTITYANYDGTIGIAILRRRGYYDEHMKVPYPFPPVIFKAAPTIDYPVYGSLAVNAVPAEAPFLVEVYLNRGTVSKGDRVISIFEDGHVEDNRYPRALYEFVGEEKK